MVRYGYISLHFDKDGIYVSHLSPVPARDVRDWLEEKLRTKVPKLKRDGGHFSKLNWKEVQYGWWVFQLLLSEGWEPFAVHGHVSGGSTMISTFTYYHLRKVIEDTG